MPNLTSVEKEFSNLTKKRGFLSSSIDKDIADSWKRCISTGLDPLKKPKRMILSSKELDELKEKNEYIRRLINPELELLYSQIAGTNFMVAYSDSTGSVMDTIYDKTCLKTDVGKIVIPGSIWREEIGGTNGLGQVVTLNKDSIVSGKEHFFESHGKLSCFASPILNHEGKTIGIIDASTDVHSREQHTLALVKLATKSIETKLFINQFKDELILSFHPHQDFRNNINTWYDEHQKGNLDAILSNTSGCGTTMKDYGFIFKDDEEMKKKAKVISDLTKDVSEYLDTNLKLNFKVKDKKYKIAYHSACSMQHGQKVHSQPMSLLSKTNNEIMEIPEGHICCGSAGTYNILQTKIAKELLSKKVKNIESLKPDFISTGNIGCITQISNGTKTPILHTIEILD
ncbi:heterodisulfide reductase-related iron-sulfur binding cluster, partial [Candidatus Pelagibacter bacterium]